MAELYDVAVLGAGPGGCTAALYAARAGLRAVVLEQLSAGGQMADAPLIENYPGFPEGVGGFELGQLMQQGAERAGAEFRLAQVTGVQQNVVQVGPYQLQISRPRKKPFLEALTDYIGGGER